jgi:two-component system sensor histidine kinase CpxA
MAQRLDGFVTGQKRFLGDTAHELLSPLARLEVALSILEQRAKNSERNTVDRALGEVFRIASLVHELLAFSKSSLTEKESQPEAVALEPLVHDILTVEAADLATELAIGPDIRVLAIPHLLRRAIGNVIRNAARYAGNDGPVGISATTGNGTVTLTIRDSGPGVPDDAIPKLFDPFFRPDISRTTVTGGTGLGLAIVKSCVEACGGSVRAENLRPRGFAVEITLPSAAGKPPVRPR